MHESGSACRTVMQFLNIELFLTGFDTELLARSLFIGHFSFFFFYLDSECASQEVSTIDRNRSE